MYICNDCPRCCGVDRDARAGFCGEKSGARVAKIISPFEYEEPCLGELSAVFFSGCNLRCTYCQNVAISRGGAGKPYTDAELAMAFDGAVGALDLVTPTHFICAIERALSLCKSGKRVIYNTSGYETESGVKRAREFTDVFLTDFKYADAGIAKRYSAAPDYFETASKAVKLMRETRDEWADTKDGRVLTRGLVVRHLVLPGHAADSMRVLDFIKAELGVDTVVSLMSQFTPNGAGEPSVRLKPIEYKLVVEHAIKLGFKSGYMQDFSSAESRYTPEFDK